MALGRGELKMYITFGSFICLFSSCNSAILSLISLAHIPKEPKQHMSSHSPEASHNWSKLPSRHFVSTGVLELQIAVFADWILTQAVRRVISIFCSTVRRSSLRSLLTRLKMWGFSNSAWLGQHLKSCIIPFKSTKYALQFDEFFIYESSFF